MMGFLSPGSGIMVVLIWPVLLLQSSTVSSNCFAEPFGIGECGGLPINATAEPTVATYFKALFGIPTNNKENGNGTTAAAGDSGVPRVKYCLYGWQVNLSNGNSSGYQKILDSSELTASDPDCTNDCSAVVSMQMGMIVTEPTNLTIHHRFYTLPILEGQAAPMVLDPFPNPIGNQPKFGTLQVTADGCTFDLRDPVPTATPSRTPSPSNPPSTPPLNSGSGGGVATTPQCWMWLTAAAASRLFAFFW
jgi:hypothetical protein